MKRFLAIALILMMLLSMAACNADEVSQTDETADEAVHLQKEPAKERMLNGVTLTYQSTDPEYPIDRYTDEQQGEYQFCRCGRPLKYRNKTPYEVTDVIVTKEQALEKADAYLTECYGDFFESMEQYEYGYEGSHDFHGQIHITYLRWSDENKFLQLNSLLFYLGHNGTVLGYDFIYHDHIVEALTAEELNSIKKSDVEAYIDDIIQTDPKQLYQNITREDLSVWHRLISKDGKPVVEISIYGSGIGAEEYYRDLSEFD
ncbi:MAG: hypothetical protein IJD11_00300 [Oscillospiraceae bacterium]|nr:hypothetical protein [Oscillospiraceae bacterium]